MSGHFHVNETHLDAAYVAEWRRSNLSFSKNAALAIVGLSYLIFMGWIGYERLADFHRFNQETIAMRGTI